ncbi:CHASE domain-containing protein [Sulfuricurvum sp.]|uniref:CHASE domain-containing protein n=1 Tax=Sulfuricurvum sp. TaxID=2025608 RepID=UPI0035631F48
MPEKIPFVQSVHRAYVQNHLNVTFLLLVSVIVASFVWSFSKEYYHNRAQALFEVKVHTNIDHFEKRVFIYENVLRSGVAYFQGSEDVEAQEWHQFIETLQIQKFYPGMQEIGFSLMIRPDEVAKVERQMRKDFPSFIIKPTGKRDQYSAILYLEPQDKRNAHEIGYDMLSDPILREAMEQARDTGLASATGRVALVRKLDSDVQPGIVMYLPLYKIGEKTDTRQERRNSLIGFIYSPYRMKNLFNDIVLNDSLVNFEVYDGAKKSQSTLLYRSFEPSTYVSRYYSHQTIEIAGRKWCLDFASTPKFDMEMDSQYPIFVTFAGMFVYFMLLAIIVVLLRSREMIRKQTAEIEINRLWLNNLLKSATDGVHILDSEGNLIEYSSSFIRSLGYSEEEARYLSIFDWEAQIPRQMLRQTMDSITQYPVMFETRHRRKDGTSFDVEITTQAIVLEGKRYLSASSRDISERKNIEKALRYEKETAQNYLDIVDVMIVVIDVNKKVKLINRRGCEIIGYTTNEVLGKNWIENFLPERIHSEIEKEVVDKLILGSDDAGYYENPVLTKKGEERLIAWRNTLLFDPQGNLIGILGSGEDITEIRQVQKQLRESEEFYRSIFSSVHEAIFILDNNRIIDCNDMALQLFEMSREALIGANILDMAWNIQCDEMSFNRYLDSAYRGDFVHARCSLVMEHGSEGIKIIETSLSGFGQDKSKLILITHDITQRLQEEKMFRMQIRQAQMGEMISMIAHQWRQPLAIINSIISQLRLKELMKEESDPLVIESLIKVELQNAHLSQTISDYRDFFRPDKPKEHTLASALVNQALDLIDHTLKSHGIKIEKALNIDSELFIYRNEVLQVLIALLKNSLDAFTENGISDGTITITVTQEDEYGVLLIHDNAGGIAPAVISRLFTPYFTTKNKNIGTGLGLYMSKMIIEEHCRGELRVSSTGDETLFTIKLPREKEVL